MLQFCSAHLVVSGVTVGLQNSIETSQDFFSPSRPRPNWKSNTPLPPGRLYCLGPYRKHRGQPRRESRKGGGLLAVLVSIRRNEGSLAVWNEVAMEFGSVAIKAECQPWAWNRKADNC